MDEQDATLPPVRLPRALLDSARAEARRRDETMSQVIRRALRAYVTSAQPRTQQIDLEEAIAASKQPPTTAALILAELDAAHARDIEYRAAFSTGSKNKLRPGETWRDRLLDRVAKEKI